jgi:oxygen-independent coproporphyrinogen-3 oxidase
VKQEALGYRDSFSFFDTLYLGGGTPSLLPKPDLAALLDFLRGSFRFAPDPEVTLEANPDDLTPGKLAFFREVGINRLSLGVQSFDDRELAFLGRRHTAGQARLALEWARAAGFTDLGLDLLYGLPGQTKAAWARNLKKSLEYSPEHLSCYQLTLEKGTPLQARAAAGEIQPLQEEAERELFLFTSRFLQGHGFIHYEVSNFARGEAHCSRHNRKYWHHVPYLGLGPAAHSFQGNRRWWNHRSLTLYCQALSENRAPVAGSESLTADQLRLEALYLGFRTSAGVAVELATRPPQGEKMLAVLQASGLVQVHRGRVRATLEGLAVADRLALCFVE